MDFFGKGSALSGCECGERVAFEVCEKAFDLRVVARSVIHELVGGELVGRVRDPAHRVSRWIPFSASHAATLNDGQYLPGSSSLWPLMTVFG